ncbi:MAG: hypothetical protein IPO19_19875 [Rhodoferax sp.]|nr:hypothetical protein [Rhodoferax sp.]MBK9238111.1 hypothetical protein [Rhodoferax sp.]
MDPLDLIFHLLNFLAPALATSVLLALLARLVVRTGTASASLLGQIGVNFLASALALSVGLWFFGRDGKVASYAAMVLCSASSQWLMQRGWRL